MPSGCAAAPHVVDDNVLDPHLAICGYAIAGGCQQTHKSEFVPWWTAHACLWISRQIRKLQAVPRIVGTVADRGTTANVDIGTMSAGFPLNAIPFYVFPVFAVVIGMHKGTEKLEPDGFFG